jgi:hypothetical protein
METKMSTSPKKIELWTLLGDLEDGGTSSLKKSSAASGKGTSHKNPVGDCQLESIYYFCSRK